jgi:hypothetical protein
MDYDNFFVLQEYKTYNVLFIKRDAVQYIHASLDHTIVSCGYHVFHVVETPHEVLDYLGEV